MSHPLAMVRFSAASIFDPLREKGRAANISSASSSLVRSFPSDFTQWSKAWSSPLVYSVMDARNGIGALPGVLPVETTACAVGTDAGGATGRNALTGLGRSLAVTAL